MTPLQLTYPQRPCVRCHQLTHEHRLCAHCMADDKQMTKAHAQALKWPLDAFANALGYDWGQQ